MTTSIIHKKSSVSGKSPLATQLKFGELAVNTYDGVVYLKKDPGTGESVVALKEVTEDNLTIDSSNLAYVTGNTLAAALEELDDAIGVIASGGVPGGGVDDATAIAYAIALG